MDRNVVVGGLLVSVSLVLALLLNSYARLEAMQVDSATPVAESDASAAVTLRRDPAPTIAAPVLEDAADVASAVSPGVGAAIETATGASATLPH